MSLTFSFAENMVRLRQAVLYSLCCDFKVQIFLLYDAINSHKFIVGSHAYLPFTN